VDPSHAAGSCWSSWLGSLRSVRPVGYRRRASSCGSEPRASSPVRLHYSSRNFVAVLLLSRFFHTKKYGRHRPRSPQNAVTVCPLRACSATSLRHFAHASFVRLVMSQLCSATESFTRWGSRSAHIMLDPDRTCSSKQREPGESGIGRSAQSPDRCSWLSPKMNKSADPRLSQESRL
jgi:hypothetical protein